MKCIRQKKQLAGADASCVVKLHQFSARETGQESPRAFKGLNETGTFKEEGFYEREILQQTVCTHLTDQYTSEDVARTKLPCYIPVCLFIPPRENFRGDNAVKIGSYFIVGVIIKKRSKSFIFGSLLAEGQNRSVKTCGNLVTEGD